MTLSVLIIGATRGLGAALVKQYASRGQSTKVYATTRKDSAPSSGSPDDVQWLAGIDLMDSSVGDVLVAKLKEKLDGKLDVLVGSSILTAPRV